VEAVTSMDEFVSEILARHEDRREAIEAIYQSLENAGHISKVTLHRFVCHKGCGPRGTVIRAGDLTLMRTEDYKFSPGYTEAHSVESARAKRTIDGARHWPKQTVDVASLGEWDGAAQIQVPCRHRIVMVDPVDLMEMVADTKPGRPGAPTRL
jgi:hypothetical protein